MAKQMIPLSALSEALEVHHSTVWRWIRDGTTKMRTIQSQARGKFMITRDSIEEQYGEEAKAILARVEKIMK